MGTVFDRIFCITWKSGKASLVPEYQQLLYGDSMTPSNPPNPCCYMSTDVELMDIHIRALLTHDERSRLLCVNEPGGVGHE